MPNVLTMASEVLCGSKSPGDPTTEPPTSPTHGGTVATISSAKLKVNGMFVILKESIVNMTVAGCSNPATPATNPCITVTSVTAGEATKLKVGGKAVILDTLHGVTNGTPPGMLAVKTKQDKLTAI